ncbi:hypothetical protein BVG79_p1000127 (plasmid) [Ketogulonicigenium robustum]|uniref:Uncharacterized protein n=1 Tax=Ketogulonicigenium robustum TaxID=92947 RepID=A0A1W6P3C9_9RHOB|nr:hypothetical protein [Ketogulonicigenium robustum]ARO15929.1 hypothetical protein BVG79_p1000127 [Ketogulonicigenium robustum]
MKNLFAIATVAAIAATAGSTAFAAQDYGYIRINNEKIEAGKPLTINLVNTSAPATLDLYSAGGKLISSRDLNAGITTDVRYQSTQLPATGLTAVLKINDQVVDTKTISLK